MSPLCQNAIHAPEEGQKSKDESRRHCGTLKVIGVSRNPPTPETKRYKKYEDVIYENVQGRYHMCCFQSPRINVLIVIGRNIERMDLILLRNPLDGSGSVEFWHAVMERRSPAARLCASIKMHLKLMLGDGRIVRCWWTWLVHVLSL